MRRLSPLLALVALVLVGAFLTMGPIAQTAAQEATPIVEADDEAALAGLSAELLGFGTAELPSPALMELARFEFAPGSGFALDPEDTAVALVYVEAGTLTFRIEAPMTVQRASATGLPDPASVEEIAPGEIFTMAEGDSAIFQPRTAGETVNMEDEPGVLLVVNIYPLEDAAATPVP